MELTKEVLEADRAGYVFQTQVAQALAQYVDGLLAYLDKPVPDPDLEPANEPEEKLPDHTEGDHEDVG